MFILMGQKERKQQIVAPIRFQQSAYNSLEQLLLHVNKVGSPCLKHYSHIAIFLSRYSFKEGLGFIYEVLAFSFVSLPALSYSYSTHSFITSLNITYDGVNHQRLPHSLCICGMHFVYMAINLHVRSKNYESGESQ